MENENKLDNSDTESENGEYCLSIVLEIKNKNLTILSYNEKIYTFFECLLEFLTL